MRRGLAPMDSGMISALVATDGRSDALLQKIPLGVSVEVTVRRGRSLPMHNLFRAILRHVAENSAWETDEKLLHGLKVYLGKYDRVMVPNGKAIIVPHSTSFSEMDQTEFAEFFHRSIQAICEFVIPGTNSDDLIREVESMLHMRDSGVRQDRPQEGKDGTPGPSGGAIIQIPKRAAVADPAPKPPEAHDEAVDGARSASETKARQSAPAAERRSGARGEDDGQTRASAVKAGGSPAPSLAVAIRPGPRQGTSDWPGIVKDLLAVIAGITDPADTGPRGRFKWQNRSTLEGLRIADRQAWGYVQQQLAERYRQLREGAG
jgi:hypothetical protein